MLRPFAAPFERFIAPARRKSDFWRVVAGVCIIVLVYGGWSYGLFFLVSRLGGTIDFTGSTPGSVITFLGTFIGMGLGTMLAVRILHNRSAATLFGRAAWVMRDFTIAIAVVAVIFAISLALWALWFDARPNLSLGLWVQFLPVIILGLLIQTGAEELVFRGYLQQQLAAKIATPLVWMVLPSLLFGLAHYDPDNLGANAWFIIAATGLFGLAAADLTARTGSLGAAWGFHFANNLMAISIIAIDGPLTGVALFVTPYTAEAQILKYLLCADMVTVLIAWAVLRRVLQR